MHIELLSKLLEERPIAVEKIARALIHIAIDRRPADLAFVQKIAEMDDLMDVLLSAPAMACIPAWGQRGIDVLLNYAFAEDRKLKIKHRALEVLLAISALGYPRMGTVKFLPANWNELPRYDLLSDATRYAGSRLREHVLTCLADKTKKRDLFYFLGTSGFFSGFQDGDQLAFDYLLDLIVDSHLLLSSELIKSFEGKLATCPEREEELQQFLTQHPILLDPFAKVLYTKQELGNDFVTDFVIRRMNNEYVLVELERSTHELFRKNGSLSAALSTAVGQVRDFQSWVAENLSYARKKLPSVARPEGLIVIGRRSTLNPLGRTRLLEENFSRRGHIKIVTYDDLLDQAQTVHANLISPPEVIPSRQTKSI